MDSETVLALAKNMPPTDVVVGLVRVRVLGFQAAGVERNRRSVDMNPQCVRLARVGQQQQPSVSLLAMHLESTGSQR